MAEKRNALSDAEKLAMIDKMQGLPGAARLEILDFMFDTSLPFPSHALAQRRTQRRRPRAPRPPR